MNAPLRGIKLFSSLITDASDIAGAANTPVELKTGTPDFETVPTGIRPDMKFLGKTYRSKAKSIAEALKKADPEAVAEQSKSCGVTLTVEGETITIDASGFTVEKERLLKGKAVDVLEVGSSTVVIMR